MQNSAQSHSTLSSFPLQQSGSESVALRYQLFNNGLYSELNNMMLGILYCACTNKRFMLCSVYSTNFERNGWCDYFEPFCEEFHGKALHRFDLRSPLSSSLLKRGLKASARLILKTFIQPVVCPGDLCTVDAWEAIRALRDQETFDLSASALHIVHDHDSMQKLNLLSALHCVHENIWRFNAAMREYLERSRLELQLPPRYAALHIRRGDKDIEAELEHESAYMRMLESKSDCLDVYVMTDDSRILPSLRQHYPAYRFYSMSPVMSGYVNADFHSLPAHKRGALIRSLLCENEILRQAEVFVGTFSSNIGVYQGIARNSNTYGVDSEQWLFW